MSSSNSSEDNNNSKKENTNNNTGIENLSPSELRAYHRGLKRGMNIAYVTFTVQDATITAYNKFPQMRLLRPDPALVSKEFVMAIFRQMYQIPPTPQEISLYELTTKESGLQILNFLVSMKSGLQNSNKNNKPVGTPVEPTEKLPYDKEKAKKYKAFELSREDKEELR